MSIDTVVLEVVVVASTIAVEHTVTRLVLDHPKLESVKRCNHKSITNVNNIKTSEI